MKKLNKLFAILVAMAMVLSLGIVSAFAAGTEKYDLSKAKITKVWTIPEGVKDPSLKVTYSFQYKADKSSGVTDADAPTIASVDATYTGTEEETAAGKMVAKNTQLPTPTPITHAGVYAFDVTESASDITSEAVANEAVTKDGTKYRVRYYYQNVKTSAEGVTPETYELQLTGITVAEIYYENAAGEEVAPDAAGATEKERKVNPTEPTENPEGITGDKVTGFRFDNTYSVTNGEEQGPTGPIELDKVALKVTKTVTGENAPAGTKFPFTINLTAAAGQTVEGIKAYVYDKNGNNVLAEEEPVAYTVEDGKIDFELENGQSLAFLQLPAGTRYAVSENLGSTAAYEVYTPSYKTTTEGTADKYSATKGAGETLATAGQGEGVTTYLLKSNEEDTVAYTNDYDNSINTPTGILISNLPYIALALVAIGGLVAYVVVRRRNADEA